MKNVHFDSEAMQKEAYDTKQAFGHDIPKNLEIEPFSYPSVSENNSRLLRRIKRKNMIH